MGWVLAKAETLRPRPIHCFQCLRTGHTGNCTSTVDRSGRCYRCGSDGHTAGHCEEAPKCPFCNDLGRPAGYRLGVMACKPPAEKEGGGRRAGAATLRSSGATNTRSVERSVPTNEETQNMDTEKGPVVDIQRARSSREEAMDTAR
ncbi:serine/arginine-rich splicing factor RS2Z33-like [Solenopsis invicta]|uniref:serine/arginine-rich splicing factor RS2Z33-like n=1 Tax=Solenopsis invicta TaxID=13686 RepID=UPI000595E19A|nr:serine/arginine-rich splicing factor RS2Z33-like [Solenopsis invicta]